MSTKRPLLFRLFGALWATIDALFKVMVMVIVLMIVAGIWVAFTAISNFL